jgi:glycosyltransferase involved in cell wall biosynthesis
MTAPRQLDITIFSTADWKASAWTNKQHVAATLASMGHHVLYIDGIGLRQPTLAVQDTRRIFRRIFRLFRPLSRVNKNLAVLSLPFLPWHQSRIAGWLNRLVISSGTWLAERWMGFRQPVLWTYHPLTARWINPRKYSHSVYHCVDEIGAQPGMDVQAIDTAERDLATMVDYVCATAPSLADKLRPANPHCEFLPNVADFDHFQSALRPGMAEPDDLKNIPRPRCGFIGAISGYKVNFELVKQIAVLRPHWNFVLIGEVGLGQTGFSLGVLPPNVTVLGPRPYAELPAYCKGFDVGLLPYHLNDYTRGVFPMKVFEYMAAGLPVISTPLPALADYWDCLLSATSPAEMAAKLDLVSAGQGPTLESRIELARSNTYQRRNQRMLDALFATKPSSPSSASLTAPMEALGL